MKLTKSKLQQMIKEELEESQADEVVPDWKVGDLLEIYFSDDGIDTIVNKYEPENRSTITSANVGYGTGIIARIEKLEVED